MNHLPIGIFDSGVGGLTVLREIMLSLPNESCVYFGDTARVPYGEKSRDTVIQYCKETTSFLLKHNVKALVIACNTATAYALEKLQQSLDIPVIGVIEPSVNQAVSTTVNNRIAILGTRGTIKSDSYQSKIQKLLPNALLLPLSCPLLVPLIEENYLYHKATKMILEEYLKPAIDADVDTILLGCTHYPLLRELIQEIVGDNVKVIHSAVACAERLKCLLDHEGLQASTNNLSTYQYFVSDDPDRFKFLGEGFLNQPIASVEKIDLLEQLTPQLL